MGAVVALGSAGGIGGAVLEALAADPGRSPWIGFRSDETAARSLARRLGGRAVQCDVTRDTDLEKFVTEVAAEHDSVDVLVHAAVDAVRGTLAEVGVPRLRQAMATSALSLVGAVGAFLPLLRHGSSVVYLTSAGSRRVVPKYGAVGVAKAAGEAIVRYLATELAPTGVRVNAVAAGPIATKAFATMSHDAVRSLEAAARRTPLGRTVTLAEVAAVVTALCGDGFTAVTGQVIDVDGGLFLS